MSCFDSEYKCSKCPVSHNKTVKLWRPNCSWSLDAELMCRECTEDREGEKLTDSPGPKINRMLPAIFTEDKKEFVAFSIHYRPDGYNHWADLPEK